MPTPGERKSFTGVVRQMGDEILARTLSISLFSSYILLFRPPVFLGKESRVGYP